MVKKIRIGYLCLVLSVCQLAFAGEVSTLLSEMLTATDQAQDDSESASLGPQYLSGKRRPNTIRYPVVTMKRIYYTPSDTGAMGVILDDAIQNRTQLFSSVQSPTQLTGIIVMPDHENIPFPIPKFPLVVLGHDTQTELALAPSASVKGNGEVRTPLIHKAELLASMGYIVLVPDYPNLSGNLGQHREIEPYLAPQIVEAILGIMEHVLIDPHSPDLVNAYWNGKIVFMGYGYGAYALMRTASVIDMRLPNHHLFKQGLKGIVGLNGFYSIADGIYEGFFKPKKATRWHPLPGYLLALWVDAYHHYQQWTYGLDNGIIPTHSGGWSEGLLNLLHSGTASLSEINTYIKSHPNYRAEQGALSIMTPDFQAFLKQSKSTLNKHDAYYLWSPHQRTKVKIHLIYHPWDCIATNRHVNMVLSRDIGAKAHALPSKACPKREWGTHSCPDIMNQAYNRGIHLLKEILQ